LVADISSFVGDSTGFQPDQKVVRAMTNLNQGFIFAPDDITGPL
jgi:hypothetical protein